nr:MAG TPA: hypothetical protein [Caudoviricetes sp.]
MKVIVTFSGEKTALRRTITDYANRLGRHRRA